MKTYYVLVDRKIWDGDPEYDQLLGLMEDNPNVLLGTKIDGVTVLTPVIKTGVFYFRNCLSLLGN